MPLFLGHHLVDVLLRKRLGLLAVGSAIAILLGSFRAIVGTDLCTLVGTALSTSTSALVQLALVAVAVVVVTVHSHFVSPSLHVQRGLYYRNRCILGRPINSLAYPDCGQVRLATLVDT